MVAHSKTLLIIRCILLILWFLLIIPFASVMKIFKLPGQYTAVIIVYKGLAFLMGINIITRGKICSHAPTLYIANHASYLDIVVFGSLLKSYFIAKDEIKSWPVIGQLARMQNTLFVKRDRKHIRLQLEHMKAFFISQKRLTLFPEGTTSDGASVLHFKSSLFEAANQALRFPIQPITVVYGTEKGRDLGNDVRHQYTWYGDDELAPHLFTLLSLKKRADIQVIFHEPVYFQDFDTREKLSTFCQSVISSELAKHVHSDT